MAQFVPDETVREIRQRIDLVRLIGESVPLRKVGQRFVGLCPFHAEKTPSFSVNPDHGFFHCFGCQASGDAITFVRETQGLSFREALEQLATRVGVALPEEEVTPQALRERARSRDERSQVLEANSLAQNFFRSTLQREEGAKAREYIVAREICDETSGLFGLGAAPASWDALTNYLQRSGVAPSIMERAGLAARRRGGSAGGYYDRFRDRLVFPVMDVTGRVLGFSARLLADEQDAPKYVNTPDSPVFHKGELLFGLYQARRALRGERRALLVEGNVDVLTLHQAGFANTVAPMGTALTMSQVHTLKRFVEEVDLVFDGDRAGRAAAHKSLELLLQAGLGGRVVLLPEGEDPDSLVRARGPEGIAALLERAPTLADYFTDEALALYDGSIPSKTKVVQAVAPLFKWLQSPVERDEYQRRLEQAIELVPGTLERYIELPDSLESFQITEPRTDGRNRRTESRVELELLNLMMEYPHLIEKFAAREGIKRMRGERRKWLAERCLAYYDWRGALDALSLIEEVTDPKMRDFVVRALNEEPTVPHEESENAFEECMTRLEERHRRDQRVRLGAELPTRVGPGELSNEVKALLRQKEQLR